MHSSRLNFVTCADAPPPSLPSDELREEKDEDGSAKERAHLVEAVLTLIEDHAAVFQNIRPIPRSK